MPLPGVHQLKYAAVDSADATGNVTLVAAVATRRITVLGYAINGLTATKVTFKSNTTALSGAVALGAAGTASYAGGIDAPAFQTVAGEALKVTAADATQISGHLTYVELDQ